MFASVEEIKQMRAKERRTIENCILNNQKLKLEKVGLEVEETKCA